MPPQPEQYDVEKRSLKRAFVQRGGPSPLNGPAYSGANGNLIEIDDLTNPVRGGINRNQNHDPNNYGQYITTSLTIDPPDFATNTLSWKLKLSSMSWVDYDPKCAFNVYEPSGFCRNPTDLYGGWSNEVLIYSKGLITDRSRTGNTAFSDDDESMITADVTWTGGAYSVGPLGLGEVASVEVAREVVDIVYGASAACGDCGVYNDGTGWVYALQQDDGASTGISAVVLYSTDGGKTWGTSAITGIGTNASVTAMDVMGSYLVVLSSTDNAYFYSAINPLTGVPGAWNKIATGFIAAKTPNDIFVVSASEAYICANGGYIYRLGAPGNAVVPILTGGAGTGNLARIDGTGETFVAAGAAGLIVKSTNRGQSWAATTTTIGALAVQALDVLDPYKIWVGTGTGQLFFTVNGGETWIEKVLPTALANIYDIVFPTFEVGYIAGATVTPTAVLFTTFTGGETFSNASDLGQRRIANIPTFNKAGRVAVPSVGSIGVRANNIAIAGLGGGGTDGIILIGAPSVI